MLLLRDQYRRLSIALFFVVTLGARGFAQSDGWETVKFDHGTISVQFRISERVDESGAKVPMIEDVTTTIADLSLQSCVALMKDPSRHKDFMGDYSSETIKALSDHEWLVYYYSKSPWPFPDTDRVAVMSFSEDVGRGGAVFMLSAAPDLVESKKVKRVSFYAATYSFTDLGNGTVEIVVTGRSSPTVEVPLWLARSAFPGASADAIRKFVRIAKASR